MSCATATGWTDQQTGREVRQLTNFPEGAGMTYFRLARHLPDGRMLAWTRHERGNLLAMDPESGTIEHFGGNAEKHSLRLRSSDGRIWSFRARGRELWVLDYPKGQWEEIASFPPDLPGWPIDISCDGRTIIRRQVQHDLEAYPVPHGHEPDAFWHYIGRPRWGSIWTHDIETSATKEVLRTDGVSPDHFDMSPTDPTLLRYCLDMHEALGQRIWTIRTDGSDRRMIRPQESGEMITHEFWWPDATMIGYTYQDRRGDDSLQAAPLAEYSPRPTRLGIADLSGRQVYLSDPLNCYHTHLYVSRDATKVCGEGTDGHSFVFAGPFDMAERKIDLVPLATIHTPYTPFRGQGVNCDFSADGRWLVYGDTVNGGRQICAVRTKV